MNTMDEKIKYDRESWKRFPQYKKSDIACLTCSCRGLFKVNGRLLFSCIEDLALNGPSYGAKMRSYRFSCYSYNYFYSS